MKSREAKDYIDDAGDGTQTITSLAYWLTPEGINPLTAALLRKSIDDDTDGGFAEAFDGATKDEARQFLALWELCAMPHWGSDEVAQVCVLADPGRTGALRAASLAQQAGELPTTFSPLQGIQWAMARGYLISGDACRLVGAQPGHYGSPADPMTTPASRVKAGGESTPKTTDKVPWKMLIQTEAAALWKTLRASGANPTVHSILPRMVNWCRENNVLTDGGINPSEGYLRTHVLSGKHWTPPR